MKKIFLLAVLLTTGNAFAAFSASRLESYTCGGLKCELWALNFASVTSGTFNTGLAKIRGAFYMPETTDDHGNLFINETTASTSHDNPGSVFIQGVTSNDLGTLLVIGR